VLLNPFDDGGDNLRSVDGVGITFLEESREEDQNHVFIVHACWLHGDESIISPLAQLACASRLGGRKYRTGSD
jgi:hypothetical protein